MKKRNLLKASKRLLALMVVSVMIAGILPVMSFAAVPTDVMYWNFDDEDIIDLSPENGIITYGANSAVVAQSRGNDSAVAGAVAPDDKYGTSIKFDITPGITDNGYMNMFHTTAKSNTTNNLVFGMSLYLDKDMDYNTHFRARGIKGSWDVQRDMGYMMKIAGSEITVNEKPLAQVDATGWYEFRAYLNFRDGYYVITCTDAKGAVHQSPAVRVQGRVDGFNFAQLQNYAAASDYSIYVDNVRIYYEADYSNPAQFSFDEDYNIAIDFNAEAVETENAAVSFTNLYTEETSGAYEYIKNDNGFITGIKITPETASSNILSVSGLKTVYGSEINFTDYISADYRDYVRLISDYDAALKHIAGDVKYFTVDATDGEVAYYNNGALVGYATGGEKIAVTLENGINSIEAKKGDATFKYTDIYADGWNLVATPFNETFDTGALSQSYVATVAADTFEQNVAGNETYALYFPGAEGEGNKIVPGAQLGYGSSKYLITYSYDVYFKDSINVEQTLGNLKMDSSTWLDAFILCTDGSIKTYLTKKVMPAGTIVPNKWYNIKVILDSVNDVTALCIDGEMVSCYVPYTGFDALNYAPVVVGTPLYMDNYQINIYESAAPSIELTSYIFGDVTPGETVKLSLNPKNVPNGAIYKAYVDGELVDGAVDVTDGTVNFTAKAGVTDVYVELYGVDGSLFDTTETVSIAAGVTETEVQYSYPTIGWCIDQNFDTATAIPNPDSASFGVGGVTQNVKLETVDEAHGTSWLLDSPGGEIYVNTAPKTNPSSWTFVLSGKSTVVEFEANPARFYPGASYILAAKYNNDSWINPVRINQDGTVEIAIYDGTTATYYAMPEKMEIGEWMKFKFVYYTGTNIGDVYINDYPVVKNAAVLPSSKTLSFINYPKLSIDGCAYYIDNYKLYTITKSTNIIANVENDNGNVEVLLGQPADTSAVTCIIAVKDSSGKLISASPERVVFTNGVYAVSSKDFGKLNEGDTVSVYVWDSLTSLKPIVQDK